MPKFTFKARDQYGQLVIENLEAPTEAVVQDILRERNLILLSMKERKSPLKRINNVTSHVKAKHIVIFARQLAVLISATVPIVRALRILSKQTESKLLAEIVGHIADEVDGGARLSSAMHQYPHVFDDFFVYMIRAGETTGRLDEVLNYLADQKEKDYALVQRIISSMIYPAFIVVVLIGMFIFMMIYVVPKLLDAITSTNAELPITTKILLSISNVFVHYWWVLLIIVTLVVGIFLVLKEYEKGKEVLDRLKLQFPLVGKIFRRIYLARISRSLANLLASGVPVNRAIEIVSDVVGNHVYKEILLRAQLTIEAGRTLSSALSDEKKYIPPMVIQMMDIGEETGRLDQILVKISEFYTSEVTALTNALASLVEPIIIILLGVGAAILVSGILLPIYSITAQF